MFAGFESNKYSTVRCSLLTLHMSLLYFILHYTHISCNHHTPPPSMSLPFPHLTNGRPNVQHTIELDKYIISNWIRLSISAFLQTDIMGITSMCLSDLLGIWQSNLLGNIFGAMMISVPTRRTDYPMPSNKYRPPRYNFARV